MVRYKRITVNRKVWFKSCFNTFSEKKACLVYDNLSQSLKKSDHRARSKADQ